MGKGFNTFMANPYWKRIYEEAPSAELKEYYRIRFDISPFVMGEKYRDRKAEARLKELPLTKEDIGYIRKNTGNNMAKQFYAKMMQKLTGEYEGWCLPAIAFQVEIWNPWYDPETNPR